MPDRIVVRGVRAYGHHGALPGEREHRQAFDVDVDVFADLDEAVAGDDLAKTVDYALIASEVRRVVEDTSFALVESLADAIARRVLELGGSRVRVRVDKPGAALAARASRVGVEVERPAT